MTNNKKPTACVYVEGGPSVKSVQALEKSILAILKCPGDGETIRAALQALTTGISTHTSISNCHFVQK